MRRSALPSVWPKPRSSGSATSVAKRVASWPAVTWSLFGRISSCQFFWIVTVFHPWASRRGDDVTGVGDLAGKSPAALQSSQNSKSRRKPPATSKHQTRRRLRGRQPLCGIVVTSRIDVTLKPAACSARSADSRPEPGPRTSTSRVFMPCSCAFLAASSAATCAAYGVDLREPLKPITPEDDHEMVLPCTSVMVIMVLLNEAFTWATPEAMFLRSRLRTRVASLPILNPSADRYRPCRCRHIVLFDALSCSSTFCSTRYFFFPAMALAGPFRVRALVWVRWPRTGRL